MKELWKLKDTKKLIKIQIRYQRVFLNNCSHAFDLISFILDIKLQIRDFKKTQSISDHFENDPTISGYGYLGNTLFEVSGIAFSRYSLFEIDMFFETFVAIDECGRRLQIFETNERTPYIQAIPDCVFSKSLAEYSDIIPVLNQVLGGCQKPPSCGNFEESFIKHTLFVETIGS